MSNWTHVAGVIRVDDFRIVGEWTSENFDDMFGKECLYGDPTPVWDDAIENPDKYLPMGSEGSLQKHVWINPNTSHVAAYTVSIFGDLRDHDSAKKIITWFKEKCDKCLVRQAVITVYNEHNGVMTYTYDENDKEDPNWENKLKYAE